MAEGIARSLAPEGVRIMSAGSHPGTVHPEAIAVLKETGIDISAHRAKNVSEIPPSDVDTVISLCAEEECPVFLGKARRLHWGLPDPAAVGGAKEDRVNAFRQTREELTRRITVFFTEELGEAFPGAE
jgi:protein-tyrosine-phosphatase